MSALCSAALAAFALVAPAMAHQETEGIALGSDRFLAGRTVVHDGLGVDDLFLAGDSARSESDIAGSVHAAARRVEIVGGVGGDAYLTGMTLTVSGAVTGDATLACYEARVGAVGGDLRVAGDTVVVVGPIGGSALISGEDVRIEGPILGDVLLRADALSFADDARVDGRLVLFEDTPGARTIPASVASEDRIERRDAAGWDEATADGAGWRRGVTRYLLEIAVLAALATLAATVAPRKWAVIRRSMLERPGRTFLRGFLVESAFFGSCILLAMTFFGLVLVPLPLLAALVLGAAGYVVAVHALGSGILLATGYPEPAGVGAQVLAAGLGAIVARSIALLPTIGWLTFLALTLVGIGGLVRGRFTTTPVAGTG